MRKFATPHTKFYVKETPIKTTSFFEVVCDTVVGLQCNVFTTSTKAKTKSCFIPFLFLYINLFCCELSCILLLSLLT